MTEQILTVSATTEGPVTVLSAAGEIDHDSRQSLEDAAEAALQDGSRSLVLDLGAVAFCDSGGLSLFVDLHKRTTTRGGRLHLASVQPAVTAVLLATNLDRLLPVHATVGEAVAAARPTG
ncbi:STAS domain-containing protein [Actinoplanes auranticolor]|uniref:Anti-sigma factor antagonist n=1 Tax=Actinoplanes auranticolor TaxID=47988 RepID=A0A919SW79_9ACTN|nr:STAS domain-containing protein [Actinoplanes auranticolor]GIM79475.1 anti-sigma factor antagonist [Actinoplanes auranticolor]